MSKSFSRRGLFQAAPLGAAAAFLTPQHADAQEQTSAIPSLKFDIEAQTHFKNDAGSANEATAAEFPISQSIAGVSMRLKPGAIRELHWHALAAEWAYMIDGRVRTTVVMPNGQSAIDEFGPGDTWYFPRGHGHLLQGLGPGEAHFLLGFDNGHFSEFGTFSITDWIANTPPEIAGRVLNLPASCSVPSEARRYTITPFLSTALVITDTAPPLYLSASCALLSVGEAKPIASPAINSMRSALPITLAPSVLGAVCLTDNAT